MSVQSVSETVYERTRNFLKYVSVQKSSNKRYAANAAVDRSKILRRVIFQPMASKNIKIDRVNKTGLTPAEYGRWLHNRGANAVLNCQEIACLSLYYFACANATFYLNYLGLRGRGDHAFVIAGALPSVVDDLRFSEVSRISLTTLCSAVAPAAESYVVDAWAGIFCHTSMYPVAFQQKLSAWNTQGKLVKWWGRWLPAGDMRYVDSIVNSPFSIREIARPFT